MKFARLVPMAALLFVLLMFSSGVAHAQNCNFISANPNSFEFPNTGGGGIVSVNVDIGCSWGATCGGIAAGGGGGNGPGNFSFQAGFNPGPNSLSGSCGVFSGSFGSSSVFIVVDPPGVDSGGPRGLAKALQYQAQNPAIGHVIGQAGTNGTWTVNFPGSQNWLSYGPYVVLPNAGDYVAAWALSVGNVGTSAMGNIDVNDATTQTEIATRQPALNLWGQTNTFQTMTVPFTIGPDRAGHQFEFRVFWFDTASTTEQVLGYIPLQYNANNPALGHVIGRSDSGGWSASVFDGQNWMQYGPYTTLSAGNYIALWTLQVDNNNNDSNAVVIVDVNDATTQTRLQSFQILRTAFTGVLQDQVFQLPFNVDASRAGHQFEFRIWYTGVSYVREQAVGVVAIP